LASAGWLSWRLALGFGTLAGLMLLALACLQIRAMACGRLTGSCRLTTLAWTTRREANTPARFDRTQSSGLTGLNGFPISP